MADTPDARPSLRAESVRVDLGGSTIIRDIAVQVGGGELVGVVGPNGSGKSTLLKALYRVVTPVDGRIRLGDLDIRRARPAVVARHLAVVSQFQQTSFDLSVREMVALGRTPHHRLLEPGSPEDRQIVTQALHATGLTGDAARSIQTLSGGELQRVALARALAQGPGFLILDEPTNHLDVRHQLQVLDIVRGLGIGVLAALHDLHLAARYCDRVYVLDHGRTVASGLPREVLTTELIRDVYQVDCETYLDPRGELAFAYAGPVAVEPPEPGAPG
ncbi:MAG TPA: ABC transporter ATP-binding protein [Cellulomonas sp.]